MSWSYARLLAAIFNELFAHVTVFKKLMVVAGWWVPPFAALLMLTVSGAIMTRRRTAMLIRL
jgi:CHASE2 domain-containing sensor protein